MENHVTSLTISKKLKELGVENETQFKYCGGHDYYDEDESGKFEKCPYDGLLDSDEYCPSAGLTCEYFIPAYLATELLEILPDTIWGQDQGYDLRIGKFDGSETDYIVSYLGRFDDKILCNEMEISLPNALGKMLIYLIEQGIITI